VDTVSVWISVQRSVKHGYPCSMSNRSCEYACRYPRVAMSQYPLGYFYGQFNPDDFSDVRFQVVRPRFVFFFF